MADTQGVSSKEESKFYGWLSYNRDVLLVVAALITQLALTIGVNPPMGFWQDDGKDHKARGSIMKDRHITRYRALSASSWFCFYSSMLLIVSLLAGVSPKSRGMKASFVFCISTLVLIYLISMPNSMLRSIFIAWALFMLWSAYILHRTRPGK